MPPPNRLAREKRDGWTWMLRQPGLLDAWFDHYRTLAEDAVKKNSERIVFPVGASRFVKFDCPSRFSTRIKRFFFSKSAAEFKAALRLEEHGIPVVKALGWGRRGSLGMLVTETFAGGIPVDEFCFRELALTGNPGKKEILLPAFAAFLKTLPDAGFYHPDFHAGNILYNPERNAFALVDVYGVKKPFFFSRRKKYAFCRVVFSLREYLSDAEAEQLINELKLFPAREVPCVWETLLRRESTVVLRDWPRRRMQILSGYRKFVTVVDTDAARLVFRNSPGGTSVLPVNLAENNAAPSGKFEFIRYDRLEAKALWLKSFKLGLLGIPHRRPLLWQEDKSSGDVSLCFPTLPAANAAAPSEEELDRFIRRCSFSGIMLPTARREIFGGTNDNIYLTDISAVSLVL